MTDHPSPESSARQAMAHRGLRSDLDHAALTGFEKRFNALPAMHHMGSLLDLSELPLVQVHLPTIEEHHRGGMGTSAVNGAVLAGLADCALGVAGVLQYGGESAGTVEMSIKFLRPARGARITALAVALKRGTHVVFAEAEVYGDGQLCALATGVVSQPSRHTGQTF